MVVQLSCEPLAFLEGVALDPAADAPGGPLAELGFVVRLLAVEADRAVELAVVCEAAASAALGRTGA